MLKSSLCDYSSDAYVLVSDGITADGEGANDAAKQTHERDKKVIFKMRTIC